MRCFIGIPLPNNVVSGLVKAEECFKKVDARMSIVRGANMHVTLVFLDEINDTAKIIESLSKVKFKQFKASVKDLSFFPKSGYIRVVHSPVNVGAKDVIALYDSIVGALGVAREEHFNPHVTLSRVKFVKSTNELSRACFGVKFEEEFVVSSFNLYKSELTHGGSVYEVIASFKGE